ncbi:MAG: SDR family oxidoreductase [Candidatus Nanohaloarchaea archaeon]|nr:SDR family oxidoreductase [Candidatus Nanohaloarchaea archaeon]
MTQTVVVTGGASGIGRATCERYADKGFNVAVLDKQQEPREGGTPTHELVQEHGSDATFIQVDVTDRSQVRDAFQQVVDEYGSIDVLVNNAGIAETETIADMDEATFDSIMQVNVYGVFHCTQAALPHMADNGSIVNIASVAGKHGSAGLSAYCASKAAVIRFTDAASKELDIPVNAVCPSRTQTAMTDFEGDPPEKVADTIYQVSQADYTGRAVDVR